MKNHFILFACLLSFSLLQAGSILQAGCGPDCPCKKKKGNLNNFIISSKLLSCCSCGDCEKLSEEVPADTLD